MRLWGLQLQLGVSLSCALGMMAVGLLDAHATREDVLTYWRFHVASWHWMWRNRRSWCGLCPEPAHVVGLWKKLSVKGSGRRNICQRGGVAESIGQHAKVFGSGKTGFAIIVILADKRIPIGQ